MTFGQRVKQLRESRGLSQPQLAEASGVALSTLRQWEQDRQRPPVDSAVKLAEGLGVDLNTLVEGVTSWPKRKPSKG